MEKQNAIASLGGTVKSVAAAVGCTGTAVRLWPDPLPKRIRDRVQAALWRQHLASVANVVADDTVASVSQ